MLLSKKNIRQFIQTIDKKTIFISIVISLMFLYYINPLINVDLTKWNRTFCFAIVKGISIDKRINNFYFLFFLVIPIIFGVTTFFFNILFKYREKYKKIFLRISAILVFPIIISYISRFDANGLINNNALIEAMLCFSVVLSIIAILDKDGLFSNKHLSIICAIYMIGIVTLNLISHISNIYIYAIMSIVLILYVAFLVKTNVGKKYYTNICNYLCLLTWLPAVILILLEVLYTLNEKGVLIERYYTNICKATILFMIFSFLIVFFTRKKNFSFYTLGCLGTIISLGVTKNFYHQYQFVFNYNNYNYLYELANKTVAVDTIFKGQIPIINNFSAHALLDVWTKILYCFIHSDVNGILADPYIGLSTLLGLVILFFILKKVFTEDSALLIICLFPFSIYGIKSTSICFLSIALLLNLIKNKKIRNHIIFWIGTLISAFFVYDEGISIGIACILTFLVIEIVQKEWKEIIKFIITGTCIGLFVLALYCVYCIVTEISIVSRIKEWISLSLGSSSSWATDSFGDPSTFAFLLAYFVAPMCAIIALAITTVKYALRKDHSNCVSVVITFALAEILYISRTIVFHNLLICSGRTGVLLNFIHWTVSLFALYELTIKGVLEEKKIFVWSSIYGIVFIVECVVVLGVPITAESILFEGAVVNSKTVEFSDDMSNIWNKERIVYSDETANFVNNFKQVFDTLLNDDETFLDFSNMTSLYMLTERERPFYIAQSPSLLTDLYSQECYLEEISEYKIPLAILGTTTEEFITSMMHVPHNVRYYTIAEYIYNNYRPLVKNGDFAIWCEKALYDKYKNILQTNGCFENKYDLIDYGYDATTSITDENGNIQMTYMPYHKYSLELIPYIWANYDENNAIENEVIEYLNSDVSNTYTFEGSETLDKETGNYLAFECTNPTENEYDICVKFYDSENSGAQYEYMLKIIPGKNNYLIRASQDYFWEAFNINNINFSSENFFEINNVRILKGD